MSSKNDCNNLYYQPFSLSMRQKLFFNLTSLSCHYPVNLSTPNFPNLTLTRTITNLPVVSNVTKNGCNNLYYHPLSPSKGQKLFSYLTSFFHRRLVNPSTPNFPNINLTRTITNLPVVSNVTKKWL